MAKSNGILQISDAPWGYVVARVSDTIKQNSFYILSPMPSGPRIPLTHLPKFYTLDELAKTMKPLKDYEGKRGNVYTLGEQAFIPDYGKLISPINDDEQAFLEEVAFDNKRKILR